MSTSVLRRRPPALSRTLAAATLALAALAGGAGAQSNTARISGTVTGEDGAPLAGVVVAARSVNTNLTRTTQTSERGFYVLPGLPPDTYELTARRIGLTPQARTLRAQIGQQLSVDFRMSATAAQLEAVQVTSAAPEEERRSPEVATNITTEQIENLPLNDRDFLEFATLAPGVVPSHNRNSITAGGQSQNLTNVYIDGVSFKNEVLTGGVAGQDASGGNPFPQSAVQEFRVISQQYKAEYAKATSAVVTATTKSGSNTFEGDVFYFGQTEAAISRDYFQERNPNFSEADFGKNQFGGSIGGPIVQDRLFFFLSYEGNHQNTAATVNTPNLAGLPQNVADDITAAGVGGTFNQPLRSNLYFGKLTWNPAERHRVSLSTSIRDEYEERGFGGNTARSRGEFFNNDVYTALLAHQYVRGNLLNEAQVDWLNYRWKPVRFPGQGVGRVYSGVFTVGGRSTEQDFIQDRWTFRNDLTYTVPAWFGAHIVKGGVQVSASEYDITRKLFGNPEFTFRSNESYAFPYQAQYGIGDPRILANNTQVGVYLQDDWNITPRFLLSLGIRWDYESDMLNNDWVTPDSVRDQTEDWLQPVPGWESRTTENFWAEDRKPFYGAWQPRLGFSYELPQLDAATLFGGAGIYYDREYYGIGIGERLNVAYPRYIFRFSEDGAPDASGNPTIAWDPSYLTEEGLRAIIASGSSAARPELPMISNEIQPPKAYQFSGGLRKGFGRYRTSISYSGVRGFDKLVYFFGNRRPTGGCCEQSEDFGNLLLAEPVGKTRYDAMFLTFERPFVNEGRWSWGGGINYTLSKAETTTPVNSNFALHVYAPSELTWEYDQTDERHRVVANFITVLPLDIRFSGIVNLGSGRPLNVVFGGDPPPELCEAFFPGAQCGERLPACEDDPTCGGNSLSDDLPPGVPSRFSARPPKKDFIIPNAWAYRDVDIRLQKDFSLPGVQRVSIIGEVFNVFDFDNFDAFSTTFASYQRPSNNPTPRDPYINRLNYNANFGNATGVVNESSRRFQLGARYEF